MPGLYAHDQRQMVNLDHQPTKQAGSARTLYRSECWAQPEVIGRAASWPQGLVTCVEVTPSLDEREHGGERS